MFLMFIVVICLSVNCYADNKEDIDTLQNTKSDSYYDKNKIIIKLKNKKLSLEEKSKILKSFKDDISFKQYYINQKIVEGYSQSEALRLFKKQYAYNNYIDYITGYAKFVSSFRMKESVEPLLQGLKDYGSTKYTPIFLIDIGEEAIEPLLKIAESSDDLMRSNAFFVLSVWVNAPISTEHYVLSKEKKIKNSKYLTKLKKCFLNGLKDNFIDVRLRSLFGLKAFPEPKVINEIEKVANNDPYYESIIGVYPVRENARLVIKELKEIINKHD